MSTILGIDPGSRVTGYGLLNVAGGQTHYIASGCINLSAGLSMADRLQHLFESLQHLIAEYQPGCTAIEQVFVGKNASSALKLGQARGVALLAASLAALPVFEYAPRAIKQSVAGTGAADKAQVQSMVVRLLKLNGTPASDAADALAVALCHAHSMRFQRAVAPVMQVNS
ncbi:MAG: crossover junction endodeoxyribonuclease RuvC [Gammaproteobacteria bacterium]|nr:crossover junction endodeoxyribonuclease RuvC [Gammaproteobacteria bacterium]MBT8150811.1 crossover junction endodeoxyribonuclease RuvC [Gammaproteobacteria bacterium]NND40329.1 crossover junction endodeoxyribonuclease RuvC [Pseudomonadales bacterium]NNL11883.1 crossover junction endodeoxyribonuclease RuvC [Pseudomonadales bacterium]NNM11546.1 crossover junction endodeoxyribonuclease RuvC [Pseudomonadales bacterium]